MKIISEILLLCFLWNPAIVQDRYHKENVQGNNAELIRVQYGGQILKLRETSTIPDYPGNRREICFTGSQILPLRIKISFDTMYQNNHQIAGHHIEISCSKKLTQDITITYSIKELYDYDSLMMPLKNGIICQASNSGDVKIASYRCAGKNEKYDADLALPLVVGKKQRRDFAILADPYFTTLFQKGSIQWTYPREVGLEDPIESRTILVIDGLSSIDDGMNMYYQTILKDVPPGPDWIRDIAMISYDYLSDEGRGWYNDIDTLVTLIPLEDRNKVALCLHGWYDIVGRYAFNQETGKMDKHWMNRIRGISMSLEDLHHRINYAKERGFRVLMYFADGLLSSKGLPDYKGQEGLANEYLWNGPDILGGPYIRNLTIPENYQFYIKYATALFNEFAKDADGFVWDETLYTHSGNTGTKQQPGYVDRTMMRLVKEVASILHSTAKNKAFFTSDDIEEEKLTPPSIRRNIPPYALFADGCYQDSWCEPSFWSYGIFPNYRNVIWSCNWKPITNFHYTVFGVYAYNTPVVFTNGWGEDRGFSEMTEQERSNFIRLFNFRKQYRTRLKGFHSLPPFFDFKSNQ